MEFYETLLKDILNDIQPETTDFNIRKAVVQRVHMALQGHDADKQAIESLIRIGKNQHPLDEDVLHPLEDKDIAGVEEFSDTNKVTQINNVAGALPNDAQASLDALTTAKDAFDAAYNSVIVNLASDYVGQLFVLNANKFVTDTYAAANKIWTRLLTICQL